MLLVIIINSENFEAIFFIFRNKFVLMNQKQQKNKKKKIKR